MGRSEVCFPQDRIDPAATCNSHRSSMESNPSIIYRTHVCFQFTPSSAKPFNAKQNKHVTPLGVRGTRIAVFKPIKCIEFGLPVTLINRAFWLFTSTPGIVPLNVSFIDGLYTVQK